MSDHPSFRGVATLVEELRGLRTRLGLSIDRIPAEGHLVSLRAVKRDAERSGAKHPDDYRAIAYQFLSCALTRKSDDLAVAAQRLVALELNLEMKPSNLTQRIEAAIVELDLLGTDYEPYSLRCYGVVASFLSLLTDSPCFTPEEHERWSLEQEKVRRLMHDDMAVELIEAAFRHLMHERTVDSAKRAAQRIIENLPRARRAWDERFGPSAAVPTHVLVDFIVRIVVLAEFDRWVQTVGAAVPGYSASQQVKGIELDQAVTTLLKGPLDDETIEILDEERLGDGFKLLAMLLIDIEQEGRWVDVLDIPGDREAIASPAY